MILPHRGRWPRIHETAFVAPTADIIGDVEIGGQSSVWFKCVIRGDVNSVRIGQRTNVQDLSILHVTRLKSPLQIGDEVTVGHRATLHGCTIGNRVLVGMGAIIMDHSEIGDESIVGAGSVVTKGTKVPSRSLVVGVPARIVRSLNEQELGFLSQSAANYAADAAEYQGYVHGPVRLGSNNSDLETFPEQLSDGYDDRYEGGGG